MRKEFIDTILEKQEAFGLDLPTETIDKLADYYELIQGANLHLHLVAPCSPQEFAVRHILESLKLLEHLPNNANFADVGAGAGLPSIPCLIARTDLKAKLIESKEKKVLFLTETVSKLGLASHANIFNKQFTETDPADSRFITCRALDKFTEKLPRLLSWAKKRHVILFAGPGIEAELKRLKIDPKKILLPLSDQRYIFLVSPQ